MEKIKLRQLSHAQPNLASMSGEERTFVLTAGHILNELNTLNKLLVWFIHAGQSSLGPESKIAISQALFAAKLIAGKLNETWEILGIMYFKTLSRDDSIELHEDSKKSLAYLKRYFNKSPNMIRELRNNVSFHYAYEYIGGSWDHIANMEDFVFLIGNDMGNTFYLGAEVAANFSLLYHANNDDFLAEIQDVQEHFMTFLEATLFAILKKRADADPLLNARDIEVDASPPIGEHRISFFCAPST